MLVPEEHDMYEIRNCFEDIYGVWPFVDKLPRVSSLWKEDESYRDGEMYLVGEDGQKPKQVRIVAKFRHGLIAVYRHYNTIDVCIEHEGKEE